MNTRLRGATAFGLWGCVAFLGGVQPVRAAEGRFCIPAGLEGPIQSWVLGWASAVAECRNTGIQIDRDTIRVHFACGQSEKNAAVLVHHPSQAPPGAQAAPPFALTSSGPLPPALLQAAAAQVPALAPGFRWQREDGTSGEASAQPGPTGQGPALDPALRDRLLLARTLSLAGNPRAALGVYLELARLDTPARNAMLNMVVATVASTQPTRPEVDAYVKDAAAHPDDPLRQFLAGVAAHYSAHYRGATPENRKELYSLAIEHLERCRAAYPTQPRVFIYLAVSHYRLGQQLEAEKLIEQSVALGANDPDAYYCRAEIWHRKDPRKALADIDRYLAMAEETRRRFGDGPPDGKSRRVRKLREYLSQVSEGKAQLQDVFDPLDPDTSVVAAWERGQAEHPPAQAPTLPYLAVGIAVGAAVGAVFLVLRLRARKRAARGPA